MFTHVVVFATPPFALVNAIFLNRTPADIPGLSERLYSCPDLRASSRQHGRIRLMSRRASRLWTVRGGEAVRPQVAYDRLLKLPMTTSACSAEASIRAAIPKRVLPGQRRRSLLLRGLQRCRTLLPSPALLADTALCVASYEGLRAGWSWFPFVGSARWPVAVCFSLSRVRSSSVLWDG